MARRSALPVTVDRDTTLVVSDPAIIGWMAEGAAAELQGTYVELADATISNTAAHAATSPIEDLEALLEIHLRACVALRALIATRDPDERQPTQ